MKDSLTILEKVNVKKVTVIYMMAYFIIFTIYCGVSGSKTYGEWDDYSLPVASLITEHNFSISDEDVEAYKRIFPEWGNSITTNQLSGRYTRNGGKMTWYFPTYSAACIPMLLLFSFLGLSKTYTFVFTNFIMVMILLLTVFYYLNAGDKCKLCIIILLSANPIVSYFSWISAEPFIFAVIGMAMVFWHNKWYKRAAISISIAGTLNPTIMFIGIIMIFEYLIRIINVRKDEEKILRLFIENLKELICYGLCYVIGIVPFIYNYYNTGHINLSAATTALVDERESTAARFAAYLFDLNFGIFPYYPLIFIIGAFLLILAIIKKHWKYLEMMTAFVVIVVLYSVMWNINCGMTNIARYSAWAAVVLIFAVCLYFNDLVHKKIFNYAIRGGIILNSVLLVFLVFYLNQTVSKKIYWLEWTPIAEYVLDNCPSVYNPLPSTFNCRTNHVPGGYEYETPIVYVAGDGYVRKILATSSDEEYLKEYFVSELGEGEWFNQQLTKLTDKETYISVPAKYKIIKCD